MVTQSSTFVWLLHTDWEAMFWPMNPMNPLNPKALRKCPAFEFASISSSTRASSTRTWSGALICQTRYFFKKVWKQNLHQLESSLDDLDVLIHRMLYFPSARWCGIVLHPIGNPYGCINLYELTTMPQSGIWWSLSWTKLAYKIYTYKSLSIKNQLFDLLAHMLPAHDFLTEQLTDLRQIDAVDGICLAIHHERQGLQHKSRSHQSQVVVFNCFPYPSNDI